MGDPKIPLKKLDGGNWGIETPIARGKHLVIRQGFFKRADIKYNYLIDRPPTIEIKGDPKVLSKGQWQFDVNLQDDYGVTNLILHMKLSPAAGDAPTGKPVDDDRPVMTPPRHEGHPETHLRYGLAHLGRPACHRHAGGAGIIRGKSAMSAPMNSDPA